MTVMIASLGWSEVAGWAALVALLVWAWWLEFDRDRWRALAETSELARKSAEAGFDVSDDDGVIGTVQTGDVLMRRADNPRYPPDPAFTGTMGCSNVDPSALSDALLAPPMSAGDDLREQGGLV